MILWIVSFVTSHRLTCTAGRTERMWVHWLARVTRCCCFHEILRSMNDSSNVFNCQWSPSESSACISLVSAPQTLFGRVLGNWCVPWLLSSVSQCCPRLVLQKWHPSTSSMFEGKGRAKPCLYQNAALCTFTWEPGNFDSHFLVRAAKRSNLDIILVFLKLSSQVNKQFVAFTLCAFILVFWKPSSFVF